MNKKGKFYANNKSTSFQRNKDNQQKSNKKSFLNRSADKRKKLNPLQEQTSEKYQRVKVGQNKSNKNNLNKNSNIKNKKKKSLKHMEYANNMTDHQKMGDNNLSPDKERKYDFLKFSDDENKVGQENNKDDNIKYEEKNNCKLQKNVSKNKKTKNNEIQIDKDDEENYSFEEEEEEKNDDLIYRTLYRSSRKNMDN